MYDYSELWRWLESTAGVCICERETPLKIDQLHHILNKNAKNAFNKKMRQDAR